MCRKVHPTSLRLGINKNYKSLWFAEGKQYVKQLHEDLKVRKFLKEAISIAGVEDIVIKRSLNNAIIDIIVARPGVVIGRGGKGLEELKKKLDIMLGTSVHLNVKDVKKPELSAVLVAKNIAEGIQKRVSYKFLMDKELEKIKGAGALGAKIEISGRVGGSEIHRTEKKKFGTVPLHTLKADIDYYDAYAKTIGFGILGVKVWIYKGNKSFIEEEL